jgi:four helix bundle protein
MRCVEVVTRTISAAMNTPKPLGKVNSYRDLVVWQKSRSLATEAYRLCMTPSFERHRGLSDQIMRSAVSIPSNIAEGDERGTNRDALRFLQIARGSLAELETQLSIAEAIGIIPQPVVVKIAAQLDEVARLLGGTIKMRKAREETDGR